MTPNLPSELCARLRTAHSVVALTGAGMSAESGVPTFRDAQSGLWARYRPEDLATPESFRRNPKLVWQWYEWRREMVRQCEPHAGYQALALAQDRFPGLKIVTQNVDGLHQRSGSREVVELHGNLFRTRCFREGTEVEMWDSSTVPPECPVCGGPLRPGVVWFGESLPQSELFRAQQWCSQAQVVLVIGTSGLVHPAASLPAWARQSGAWVVEINPEETVLSGSVDLALRGTAASLLPRIVGEWLA